MFSLPHVMRALHAKRQAFLTYDSERLELREHYTKHLQTLAGESQASIRRKLQGIPKPGALPTSEREPGRSIVLPFPHRWEHHREARAWALKRLQGIPTYAVDGSQITPDPSLAVPIGAVQIGWFENPHDASGRYVKDILFEVLAPNELSLELIEHQIFPDQFVNMRRFELECRTLADYMRAHADAAIKPICFFDGSLVISFAAQMRAEMRQRYIACIQDLLDASEKSRVPLVGYVDTSYATDLVSMLQWLYAAAPPTRFSDGALLRPLMQWGDRTEAFVCARDDGVFQHSPHLDYYERVHFVYLKTTAHNMPARLDLPCWLLEEGLLEHVIDIVRAECIVGTGYPYAAETADAVAVITTEDRERFYRAFQEFAAENGLTWGYARKALSKRIRR